MAYARAVANRELTAREFGNLGSAYPTIRFDADQWGEHGFFYDPVDRQFGMYSIDRKNQIDDVAIVDGAEAVLACCSEARRADVQAWLDSFRIRVSGDETLLWYPAREQLVRFRSVGDEVVVTGKRAALEALQDETARRWLKEQLG